MADDHDCEERPEAEVYRPPPGSRVWYEQERDEVSLFQLVNVLLRHRWKVVGVPLVLAAGVVVWTVLQPPTFTSNATLMPSAGTGEGQFSRLSGVASQFGINVPGQQAGQSPQFYADLLTSRRLLEETVVSEYEVASGRGGEDASPSPEGAKADGTSGRGFGKETLTLVDLYDLERRHRTHAVAVAARRLERDISVSTNSETGVVDLSVKTRWPGVSQQVADRLIDLVNRFNNKVRQSQAAAEADFVEDRLAKAERELRSAEDSLQAFLMRNVSWQQSPELRLQHDRLQRRVNLKQQVYTSLATRYEEAQIAKVKSTPVVTTVSRPQIPARPDPRRLPVRVLLALVLGTVAGALWAFGWELAGGVSEQNADDYREFLSLKRDAAADVKEAGRRIRRLLSGNSP